MAGKGNEKGNMKISKIHKQISIMSMCNEHWMERRKLKGIV